MESLVVPIHRCLERVAVHWGSIANLEHGCSYGLRSPLLNPVQVALVGLWLMLRQDPVGSLDCW